MKRKIRNAVLSIILAFFLCSCGGMDEVSVETVEAEDIPGVGAAGGQRESIGVSGREEEPTETDAKLIELLYGDVGSLGIGTLAYTAPVKEGGDYRMYFFAGASGVDDSVNLSDASYVFPDAREGNAAIGTWKEIYYMDIVDISEDGAGDIFVAAIYEKDGEARYDTRVYAGEKNGYRLDSGLTQKLNEEYCHVKEYPVQDILSMLRESGKTAETSGTGGTWQEAYKAIICDPEDQLSDPYDIRFGFDGKAYLGIHDFDSDDIPELIIGDPVSAAVFTYSNGAAIKIADLYEPDYWGGINDGLLCGNNTLLFVSNGSDGSGYVCFTYKERNYIKGFCDDYDPDIGTINEKQVSRTDFERWFVISELMKNGGSLSVQINHEAKTVCVNNHTVGTDELDFDMIRW